MEQLQTVFESNLNLARKANLSDNLGHFGACISRTRAFGYGSVAWLLDENKLQRVKDTPGWNYSSFILGSCTVPWMQHWFLRSPSDKLSLCLLLGFLHCSCCHGISSSGTDGLLPGPVWYARDPGRYSPAILADFGPYRLQHRHSCGQHAGLVDGVCLPEHGSLPVRNLQLHAGPALRPAGLSCPHGHLPRAVDPRYCGGSPWNAVHTLLGGLWYS